MSSFALLLALVLAPLTHVHATNESGHPSALVHSHFSGHAARHSKGTSVSDDDDHDDTHATQLDIFNLTSTAPLCVPDLPMRGFLPPAIRANFGHFTLPLPCAHDPPIARSADLRAPPV